ncbi:MAG: ammonia channel protein, partial [Limisphaerales bacterium]
MKKFFTTLLTIGMLWGVAADVSAQAPPAVPPAAATNAVSADGIPPGEQIAEAPAATVAEQIEAAIASKEAEAGPVDSGNTAWMIVATVLVLFMTLPGLALFYGGLVRQKNVLSILMQCFAMAGIMTLLWVIYGYSLAFT